jgi:hypothetical protein
MTADVSSLKSATKTVLREISKHANTLATGLQSAAPPQSSGPNKSILYLTEIAKELDNINQEIDH